LQLYFDLKKTLLKLFLFILFTQNTFSQCFEIESILVDACGSQEGLNEMVRFKVGGTPLNTAILNVNWPNNGWQGLVQNATTALKVATLNTDIIAAGGCAQLIEPIGGNLPANASVLLVTSFNFDITQNSFGALAEDVYIIFQNNLTTTTGHFANFGIGLRTLTMTFGTCFDFATYDRGLLVSPTGQNVASDGSTVLFSPSGIATYVNYGCLAPIQPFLVAINNPNLTACSGDVIALNASAEGYQSVLWTAPSGSFSDSGSLTTSFTIPSNATGSILVTLTATNICGLEIIDTILVTITDNIVPDFATSLTLCSGTTAPVLNTTSPNGIVGIWNPLTINNVSGGNYIFTPNANQCASPITLVVTITDNIVPDFATSLTLCTGTAAPPLNTTSPNGIVGTWNPLTINNTVGGNYVFTPNANQCASPITLVVTITDNIVPDFATSLTLCSGTTAPALNSTSPNGIVGIWNPLTINNISGGNYIFTPNANQCASSITLVVTITNTIVPDFDTTLTLCSGTSAPALNTTSPNGIVGIWNPSTINNTVGGNYIFTPNANQCASTITLVVTITDNTVPDFATSLTLCSGTTAPALNTTSPNGIVGIWNPLTINNISGGNYIFTPNANQCASPITLAVTITDNIVPDFATSLTLCTGTAAPALNTTSPNGIVGTWNPSTINNTLGGNYIFTPIANQCASSITLVVTITNTIVPDFDTTLTLCSGTSAPALNSTSPNGIVGTWNPSTINNISGGNYIFTPNPNQCALPITLNVTINSISVSITGAAILCIDQSTQWTSSISGGTWSSNDITIATIDANGNVTAVGSGITTINYFIQGSCDTTISETIEIINPSAPNLIDSFVCVDKLTGDVLSPVLLQSGLSNTDYTFVWTVDGDALPTTQNNHLATETGVYIVTATHNATGCSGSSMGTVTASSTAIGSATVGEDFNQNQVITVTVTGGSGDYEYILNDGPSQTSNFFTNVLQGENVIIVRDKNGCNDLILIVYSLNYPPFFTPNGDGYNDTWNISGLENQPNAIIYIFDRYGKLLKMLKASDGNGWNGTYNGENLPSTDYWFKLLYAGRDGFEKEFKAHFSLKR
jgi:gliding motility-associated-like protein